MFSFSHFAKACLGVVAFAAIGFGAQAGCSSSETTASVDSGGGLVCPTTIADVGKACAVEGKVCGTGYACGSFNQQASCTCTGGHFACNDATGAPIANGATPACVPQGDGSDNSCPATEALADSKKCTVSGLICRYAGVQCPQNPPNQPNQDVCMCQAVLGGGGKAFRCEPSPCNPTADAGGDAGSDAADAHVDIDSNPPVDAGTDGG